MHVRQHLVRPDVMAATAMEDAGGASGRERCRGGPGCASRSRIKLGCLARRYWVAAVSLWCATVAIAACGSGGAVLVVEGDLEPGDQELRRVSGWKATVVRAAGATDAVPSRVNARWPVNAVPLLLPVERPDTRWSPVLAGALDAARVAYGSFSVERVNALLADQEIALVAGPDWAEGFRFDAGALLTGRSVTIKAGQGAGIMSAVVVDGHLYATIDSGSRSVQIEPVQGRVHAVFERVPSRVDRTVAAHEEEDGWPPARICTDRALDIAVGLSSKTTFPYPHEIAAVIQHRLEESFRLANIGTFLGVKARNVTGVEAGDLDADLLGVQQKSDGAWDELHVAPSPDLAMLVVSEGDATDGVGLSTIGATVAHRFAVVTQSAALDLTPVHEFGHLAGADHEPGLQSGPRLPFGHGFVDCREHGSRTLMALGLNCGHGTERVNRWSSVRSAARLGKQDVSEVDRLLQLSLPYLSSLSCMSAQ